MCEEKPDFEALRAERNRKAKESLERLAKELGVTTDRLVSTHNPSACYCACASGGPCEHKWDGEPWESEDGLAFSVTCSLCGCTAMSHDMRVLP